MQWEAGDSRNEAKGGTPQRAGPVEGRGHITEWAVAKLPKGFPTPFQQPNSCGCRLLASATRFAFNHGGSTPPPFASPPPLSPQQQPPHLSAPHSFPRLISKMAPFPPRV